MENQHASTAMRIFVPSKCKSQKLVVAGSCQWIFRISTFHGTINKQTVHMQVVGNKYDMGTIAALLLMILSPASKA